MMRWEEAYLAHSDAKRAVELKHIRKYRIVVNIVVQLGRSSPILATVPILATAPILATVPILAMVPFLSTAPSSCSSAAMICYGMLGTFPRTLRCDAML